MSQETNETGFPNINVVVENSPNTTVEVTITIREAIQRVIDESNVEGAAGGRVILPSGESVEILGDDNDALYTTDESGRRVDAPLPEGARVEPVKSVRGA